MRALILVSIFMLLSIRSMATHVMGGELTWTCSGNGYIFELVFYRDCNGADVNSISENVQVWGHPTVTQFQVLFVNRIDISPSCTQVAGSPTPFVCGSGANAGNGVGAIERVVYRSNPVILPGIPPASGWHFTYKNFSRSGSITNLQNPSTYGITISASMFAPPNAVDGVCMDNSPVFLQAPYLVACQGDAYEYNPHPVDPDRDSVVLSFGVPLDHFTSGSFNPPVNPAPVPFEVGFSASNPTPDASFGAGNVPAVLDPITGNLTFTTTLTGSYVVKIVAQSYRNGILIGRVEREMQLVIVNCAGTNTAPVVNGPFAGAFETTVIAGTLVNFSLSSNDPELLQDGSPQQNLLSATGVQFGTNFTSTAGCTLPPCATLDMTPVISGIQGASTQFSWQTDCDHLVDAAGNVLNEVPYTFVFKVQDDYCAIPKVTYKTITIHVQNPGIIPATQIECIHTETNGDLTITWAPVVDPFGTYVGLELYSLQGGLIGTYPIGTNSVTIPAPGADLDFYTAVVSGCNGNAKRYSDTVRNVYLTLFNPANGTAQLSWNLPADTPLPGMDNFATIYREYPTGTWTALTTLPYGVVNFTDTIDICEAVLNYQIVYNTPVCVWNSNIDGELLEDMMTPDIPEITSVSVDTLTGILTINWNQNEQPDTYGYVIYQEDANGFIVEIDTAWGIGTTSYTFPGPVNGPLTFSVAAFDSCFTDLIPPTYQTSAKAPLHTSMFTTASVNICNGQTVLNWTPYEGWGGALTGYTVFMRVNGGAWFNSGDYSSTSAALDLEPLKTYCFAIRANNINGAEAFAPITCFFLNSPPPPAVHYLRVASVGGSGVDLRHEITTGTNVTAVRFQRRNTLSGQFETLGDVPATSSTLTFRDENVQVDYQSYEYRAIVIDSCGGESSVSNYARTILLQVETDQTAIINFVNWSAYGDYAGGVLRYYLYRSVDDMPPTAPIAVLDPDQRYFEDPVGEFGYTTGRFCYWVVAEEATNFLGIQEYSTSNDDCGVIEPLVYIPNAFTPEGANPIFKPIVSFHDFRDYECSIVDRWGQVVFQSTDPDLGWNGTHRLRNEIVPVGVYCYVVRVVDGNNQEYYFRGTVTVVR